MIDLVVPHIAEDFSQIGVQTISKSFTSTLTFSEKSNDNSQRIHLTFILFPDILTSTLSVNVTGAFHILDIILQLHI
jgi:hypothetical protein